MALINSTGDLMAIKVLINGLFMPIHLQNHLFMTISFKLMAIKMVVNEVARSTGINFSVHFSELLN